MLNWVKYFSNPHRKGEESYCFLLYYSGTNLLVRCIGSKRFLFQFGGLHAWFGSWSAENSLGFLIFGGGSRLLSGWQCCLCCLIRKISSKRIISHEILAILWETLEGQFPGPNWCSLIIDGKWEFGKKNRKNIIGPQTSLNNLGLLNLTLVQAPVEIAPPVFGKMATKYILPPPHNNLIFWGKVNIW